MNHNSEVCAFQPNFTINMNEIIIESIKCTKLMFHILMSMLGTTFHNIPYYICIKIKNMVETTFYNIPYYVA